MIFDICEKLPFVTTPGATEKDLATTAEMVEDSGRRCIAERLDARDLDGLKALANLALERFGRVDHLIVNHGAWTVSNNSWELDDDEWGNTIDHMLTGAWKVSKAFIPAILEGDVGGAIVITSSANATVPLPGSLPYGVAKAGVIQMMRVLARELGPREVRVNVVSPGGVATPMTMEGATASRLEEIHPTYQLDRNALPVGLLPPDAISETVAFLLSSEARYITGAVVPVDAGWTVF